MLWEQLSINKPHLAYIIIGGFTSLFMLCSLFVKEKLYIGEATVATITGVIFGPHAANLFNPLSWGNTDQITLECSRVVLVVQCFAVGVELPKAYMERHWRSVVFLLVPVMTFGWLIVSLIIWWMIEPLTWLESLLCAACVTATDPVLASSVVGKGKFAKRVPKHLRDLLSAESGCNDGMAFPFIYLSYYLIHYHIKADNVVYHWFCNTILYECIFGAIYGVLVGYLARHAIKLADRKGLIDRESFLVFYFVLALFCAGTGSSLGLDDLLVGFAAGVGFSNDGWFTQKTEESHVSNVIDLLLNLAYFVYLGAVIPWEKFNAPEIGLTPWRLVVIAIFVILFRRVPIMLALKPFIPDIKTWREALFAGHFGPIGVGAIFAAILARAELENGSTEPEDLLPGPEVKNYMIIQIIWPLTTFLVITSIVVHGSSIAVFTLGKRINTLTLTMSFTQAEENGQNWMNRLPRIASSARTSFSRSKEEQSTSSSEIAQETPPGTLPPVGLPRNFLRQQKNEASQNPIGKAQISRPMKRRKWDAGMGRGPGGPISPSAIAPQPRLEIQSPEDSSSDRFNEKSSPNHDQAHEGLEMQEKADAKHNGLRPRSNDNDEPEIEVYQEGNDLIIEDEEGNVLSVTDGRGESEEQKRQHILDAERNLRSETSGEHAKGKFYPHVKDEGEELKQALEEVIEHPDRTQQRLKTKLNKWNGWGKKKENDSEGPSLPKAAKVPEKRRGPAHAYQFGNTVILEDEDGEVIEKYDIPGAQRIRNRSGTQDTPSPHHHHHHHIPPSLKRMGTWAGFKGKGESSSPEASGKAPQDNGKELRRSSMEEEIEGKDDGVRFTITAGGRRMSKADFFRQIQSMDPKARREAVLDSDAPQAVKEQVFEENLSSLSRSKSTTAIPTRPQNSRQLSSRSVVAAEASSPSSRTKPEMVKTAEIPQGGYELTPVATNTSDVPVHPVRESVNKHTASRGVETAAQRRRRVALASEHDSDDDGTPRIPPSSSSKHISSSETGAETNVERRRRLAVLGGDASESDSDDDGGERVPEQGGHQPISEPGAEEAQRAPGIRFAETPTVSQGRVQWGNVPGLGKKLPGKK